MRTKAVLVFCLLSISLLSAQQNENDIEPKEKWFNGLRVETDLANIVYPLVRDDGSYMFEGVVQADILHKFYPTLKVGYGGADKSSNNEISFETSGCFGSLGMNLNLLKKQENKPANGNIVFVGLHFGYSGFDYDLMNVMVVDDYWGTTESKDFPNQHVNKFWVDIMAGVRVDITKHFFMGWHVENKRLIEKSSNGKIAPWYIPGYGKNQQANWLVGYSVGWKF